MAKEGHRSTVDAAQLQEHLLDATMLALDVQDPEADPCVLELNGVAVLRIPQTIAESRRELAVYLASFPHLQRDDTMLRHRRHILEHAQSDASVETSAKRIMAAVSLSKNNSVIASVAELIKSIGADVERIVWSLDDVSVMRLYNEVCGDA